MAEVSETRMVDIQPPELYEDLRNVAANEFVLANPSFDGSAEALALKQAFVLGANTSLQFTDRHVRLIQAVIAGRKWGLSKRSPEPDEPDDDLLRKQEIEDAIARGDDL